MNSATQPTSQTPFPEYFELDDLLCAAYGGSEYRFGELHFDELIEDESFPGMEAYCVHQISMVLHPERGAMLLRLVEPGDDPDPFAYRRDISRTYTELVELRDAILERLAEYDDFWKERPVVMGVGVVLSWSCPRSAIPREVPKEAIIYREEISRFPTRVDHLFDSYCTEEVRPFADWAPRLIKAITEPEYFFGFVDEECFLDGYVEWGQCLDDVVESVVRRR